MHHGAAGQRVIGLGVSDVAMLGPFAQRWRGVLALSSDGGRGHWGLGFHRNGDMLVKKGPLGRAAGMDGVLQRVRARQLVLAATLEPGPRRTLEDAQPLRYRDWLCACAGTETLDVTLPAALQAQMPDTVFGARRTATPEESVLMLFTDALHQAGVRDGDRLTTTAIRAAIARGAERLSALSSGGVALAVLLATRDHLFALSLGRPLWLARFRGLNGGSQGVRHDPSPHLRAVVVSDRAPATEGVVWEQIPAECGVEIGERCEPGVFAV